MASGAASSASSRRARLLRKVLRGTLIAGSSMVLAACYGCPPDECGDDLEGPLGGAAGSGGAGTGGNLPTGGAAPTGGGAGEGGLGGFGGDAAP